LQRVPNMALAGHWWECSKRRDSGLFHALELCAEISPALHTIDVFHESFHPVLCLTLHPIFVALPGVILGGIDRHFVHQYFSLCWASAAQQSFWAAQHAMPPVYSEAPPLECVLGGAGRHSPSVSVRRAPPPRWDVLGRAQQRHFCGSARPRG